MKKNTVLVSWLLVIACMITIFTLSAQIADDSRELSEGVTMHVFKIVKKLTPNIDITFDEFTHIIRKCAHFTIYFILGVLVLNAFRRGDRLGIGFIYISFVICVLYAISDELHQAFVPGRGPAVFDVFIDSLGGLSGIIFYLIISKLKNRLIKKTAKRF